MQFSTSAITLMNVNALPRKRSTIALCGSRCHSLTYKVKTYHHCDCWCWLYPQVVTLIISHRHCHHTPSNGLYLYPTFQIAMHAQEQLCLSTAARRLRLFRMVNAHVACGLHPLEQVRATIRITSSETNWNHTQGITQTTILDQNQQVTIRK